MKKIAIIAPTNLPIPATKGGAVETGIQQVIDENEKKKRVHIDIFSYYEKVAEEISKNYKATTFYYYRENKIRQLECWTRKCLNYIFRKLRIKLKINPRKGYSNYIENKIKKENYEAILIKNAVDLVIPIHKVTDDRICLQLHNDFLNQNIYNSKKIVNYCDRIITNSEYIKRCVLTIEDAKNKPILVNKNCLELKKFYNVTEKEKKELIEKYKIDDDKQIILFSGRMVPQKGIKELLLAIERLPQEMNWKLYVIGGKWFNKDTKDAFQKEILEMAKKLKNKVECVGFVPYQEIPVWNKIADVVVVPSIWEEPAGRVAIEAQAAGTPLIISDAGGIKEYVSKDSAIIVKRGTNFVEEIKKEILEVLKNKEIRKNMSNAGIRNSKNYTVERYYEEIIEELNIGEQDEKTN